MAKIKLSQKSLTLIELVLGIVLLALVVTAVSFVHTTFIKNITKDIRQSTLYQQTSFAMEHITKRIQTSNYLTVLPGPNAGTILNLFKKDPANPTIINQSQYYLDASNRQLCFVKDVVNHPTDIEILLKNVKVPGGFSLVAVEPLDPPTNSQYRAARIIIQAQDAQKKKDIPDSFLQSLAGCRVVYNSSGVVRLVDASGNVKKYYDAIQPAIDDADNIYNIVQCMGKTAGFNGVFNGGGIVLLGRSVTLKGSFENFDGQGKQNYQSSPTILDGAGALEMLRLYSTNCRGKNFVIDGFTFRNITGKALSLVLSGTWNAANNQVTVSNNIFSDNNFSATYAAGQGKSAAIYIGPPTTGYEPNTFTISNNKFLNNTSSSTSDLKGLIYVESYLASNGNDIIVQDNLFHNNNIPCHIFFEILDISTGLRDIRILGNTVSMEASAKFVAREFLNLSGSWRSLGVDNNTFSQCKNIPSTYVVGITGNPLSFSGNKINNNTGSAANILTISLGNLASVININNNIISDNTLTTENDYSFIEVLRNTGVTFSGNAVSRTSSLNSSGFPYGRLLRVEERVAIPSNDCTISNNIISDNSFGSLLLVSPNNNNSDKVFSENIISGNTLGATAIELVGRPVSFKQNTIIDNHIECQNCSFVKLPGQGSFYYNIVGHNIFTSNVNTYTMSLFTDINNTGQLINNTVVYNSRPALLGSNLKATIDSCIFWDNDLNGNYAVTYSDAPNITPGVNGNLNEDPRFIAGAPFDYHLNETISPCVDKGSPLAGGELVPPGQKTTARDMGAYGGYTAGP